MNQVATPSSERLHIGFFGMRNAGKSSIVNAITNQNISIVSDIKGTTTDPVKKAMEILPLGPVVIIDTPGFDDEGTLGQLRKEKTSDILNKTDIAVLVIDSTVGISNGDKELIALFESKKIPFLKVYNKADKTESDYNATDDSLLVSAQTGKNIDKLKTVLSELSKSKNKAKPLIDDLIKKGDLIVLVTPIDESAPKGRLILPQQLTLRNILDNNCTAVVCKETELEDTLEKFSKKPDLVITDSQVFDYVSKVLPDDVKLTSFSIVFARYKGDLIELVKGAAALEKLSDGDRVLISEGCTHHRQCNDIGTVKMPTWIRNFTGKNINFEFTSGGEFTKTPDKYRLIVHCGGCMLNEKEMKNRIELCSEYGIPIVNYGIAIAHMHGILRRSLEVFPEAFGLLK